MSRTFIIAEAGVNHNGEKELALQLVDAAAAAGADAVKFQTFTADALCSAKADLAEYQKKNSPKEQSQHAMLKRLELPHEWHFELKARAEAKGIEFMSTPFDLASLEFLAEKVKVKRIKLGSGEVTNGPLILKAARTGLPVILSTGMANMEEIEDAVRLFAFGMNEPSKDPSEESLRKVDLSSPALKNRLTLLQCVTDYPAREEDLQLGAILAIRERFGLPVGYSDHALGSFAAVLSVAAGSVMLEKHLTLDKSLEGPDHKASSTPGEFRELVREIRQAELIFGDGEKRPREAERKNIPIARKVLVAAKKIRKGETLDATNVAVKRAGAGISPMRYWATLGSKALRDFEEGDPV